jgi:hypothetical protein
LYPAFCVDNFLTWQDAFSGFPKQYALFQIPRITYVPNTPNTYMLAGVFSSMNTLYTKNDGVSWSALQNITILGSGGFTPSQTAFSSPNVVGEP